jgi:hypothetical protein
MIVMSLGHWYGLTVGELFFERDRITINHLEKHVVNDLLFGYTSARCSPLT